MVSKIIQRINSFLIGLIQSDFLMSASPPIFKRKIPRQRGIIIITSPSKRLKNTLSNLGAKKTIHISKSISHQAIPNAFLLFTFKSPRFRLLSYQAVYLFFRDIHFLLPEKNMQRPFLTH